MAVKQTAGRTALGEFAPKFAELNDDVLFGQVWSYVLSDWTAKRRLCTVFCVTKLSCPCVERAGGHFQCDL